MMNYLYSRELHEGDFTTDSVKLDYLKTYLNDEKTLDKKIRDEFPISSFGAESDELKILGSKTLLDMFDDLDTEKFDFTDTYANVEFVGIDDTKQIKLNFPAQQIHAHGIYDFYTNFLEQFGITKYIDYCISHEYQDIINTNIKDLLEKNSDREKQFRLLRDTDETWGIRALTSDSYKNYDNGVVLYLSLLAIHRYAVEQGTTLRINSAYMSDSFMHVFFERPEPINIPDIGQVYLGLAVSNGEIRNYKFKVELRYRIVDSSNHNILAAIYDNPLFSVVHNMNASTISNQLDRFSRLNQYENSIIEFIKKLSEVQKLTEDSMYYLLNDLLRNVKDCSDISTKTKDAFKKLETEHLIGNTLSLISFLDKVQTISTDMDEKVFVERIFHRVLSDLIIKTES